MLLWDAAEYGEANRAEHKWKQAFNNEDGRTFFFPISFIFTGCLVSKLITGGKLNTYLISVSYFGSPGAALAPPELTKCAS